MKYYITKKQTKLTYFYKIWFLIIIFSLAAFNATYGSEKNGSRLHPDTHNAIVQVHTESSKPSFANPWVTKPDNKTGAGFIISEDRILTNAHVVADNRSIKVRKALDNKEYEAKVLHISHEADLALLTVEDSTFFSRAGQLGFRSMPDAGTRVEIYGFPAEEGLTITDAIVADIKHRMYRHSSSYFLAGEVLSKIEPGHSGGPVIYDGKVIGIIMQANKSGSVGHMITGQIIDHFLNDIEDGQYDGFPDMGLITQTHDDSFLYDECETPDSIRGVRVSHIISGSPAEGKIMKNDVLLRINGQPIADDGTVEFRAGERTNFNYAIEMKNIGEEIRVDLVRSGIIRSIKLTLDKTKKDFLLIPREQYDTEPRYFIFGGIIFSPLTKNILNEWKNAPEELVSQLTGWPTTDRKEVVIALQVLPAEVNRQFQGLSGWIINEVNGRGFKDFNEFYRMVAFSDDPQVVFRNTKGSRIVLDRRMAEASHESILRTYSIREDRSPDLREFHVRKQFITGKNYQ